MRMSSRLSVFYAVGWLMALLVMLFVVSHVIGCQAGGTAHYIGDYQGTTEVSTTTHPDGTVESIVKHTGHKQADGTGGTIAPADAKEGSNVDANDSGVNIGSGAAYESRAVDYTKKNGYIFYIACPLFILAGLAIFFFLPTMKELGVAVAAAGLLLALLPTFIDKVGGILSYSILIALLVGGALWAWVKRSTIKESAGKVGATFAAQGKLDEAVTARSAIDPEYKKDIAQAKTNQTTVK